MRLLMFAVDVDRHIIGREVAISIEGVHPDCGLCFESMDMATALRETINGGTEFSARLIEMRDMASRIGGSTHG